MIVTIERSIQEGFIFEDFCMAMVYLFHIVGPIVICLLRELKSLTDAPLKVNGCIFCFLMWGTQ